MMLLFYMASPHKFYFPIFLPIHRHIIDIDILILYSVTLKTSFIIFLELFYIFHRIIEYISILSVDKHSFISCPNLGPHYKFELSRRKKQPRPVIYRREKAFSPSPWI